MLDAAGTTTTAWRWWCPERLRQLSAACTANPEFAGLIRELNVVEVGYHDGIPELLPWLTSVTRLEVPADQLDARLLAIINEHRTLVTVAVLDPQLKTLRNILSSTNLPLSKILVSPTITVLDDVTLQAFRAAIQRGARFYHFIFEVQGNLELSAATLPIVLPDLEHFDLKMCYRTNISRSSINSWLHRHAHDKTGKCVWALEG
ncbi:hypothetical protein DFH06DRAFT_1339446 [Mycena polygramma]|nr:hypothetical protein DFH06DRAFT_1339446 [Mycena polygramma]